MPLNLPNFFLSRGYLINIPTYRISGADLSPARNALNSDIDAFLLNGLLSFASSINSLNKRNYSWSFIQSYYSIFYLAKAFNGIHDYAIVYKDKKPYSIKIQIAEGFTKLSGNSHDVVLEQFKNEFSTDTLLVNRIEEKSPIDWFNDNRNLINYRLNPQTDPVPPIPLFIYKNDLRKWITTYLNDVYHLYTFDPMHCFISYPIQLFNRIFQYYIDNDYKNVYLAEDQLEHFRKNLADDRGPISPLILKIQELCV